MLRSVTCVESKRSIGGFLLKYIYECKLIRLLNIKELTPNFLMSPFYGGTSRVAEIAVGPLFGANMTRYWMRSLVILIVACVAEMAGDY